MFNNIYTGVGYLEIDHRDSPGVKQEDFGLDYHGPIVGKGQVFKADYKACSHCQRQILLDPLNRFERHYCEGCNKYICNDCKRAKGIMGCIPFKKILDKAYDAAATGRIYIPPIM